jgi:hypothetical protein
MTPAPLLRAALLRGDDTPEVTAWLRSGFSTWIRSGGVGLLRCLQLPNSPVQINRVTRD